MTSKIMKTLISDKNKGTVTEDFYQKLTDFRKEKYANTNGWTQKKTFSPSSFSGQGQCARYWHYAFNGADFLKPFIEKNIIAMQAGSAIHEVVQNDYEDAFDNARIEKKTFNESPPIFGFIDAIVNIEGEDVVIDIKTVNDNGYNMREQSLSPAPAHKLQVLLYMHMEKAEHGGLHYINKSSGDELFFPIRMNDAAKKYVDEVLNWLDKVYEAKDGPLPKRPFEKNSFQCRYCPVSKVCWSDENGSVEIESLKVR